MRAKRAGGGGAAAHKALARAIAKAEPDQQRELLDEEAGPGGEAWRVLWDLTRSGALATEAHGGLWELLAEGAQAHETDVTVDDIAGFLARVKEPVKAYRKVASGPGGVFSFWPQDLDRLAVIGVLRDRAALTAAAKKFAAPVKKGFATVLRRFEALPVKAFGPPFLSDMAKHLASGRGGTAYLPHDGRAQAYPCGGAAFAEVPPWFGTAKHWGAALLPELLRHRDHGLPPAVCADAIAQASRAQLVELVGTFGASRAADLALVLIDRRGDRPADLAAAAATAPADDDDAIGEACAIAAVVAAARRGQRIDPALGAQITLAGWSPVGGADLLMQTRAMTEALAALPAERAREIVRRRLAEEEVDVGAEVKTGWQRALPFLGVLPTAERDAALTRVVAAIEAGPMIHSWLEAALGVHGRALLELPTIAARAARGRPHRGVIGGLIAALERARAEGDEPPGAVAMIQALVDRLGRDERKRFDDVRGLKLTRLPAETPSISARAPKAAKVARTVAKPPADGPARSLPVARSSRDATAKAKATSPATVSGPTVRVFLLARGTPGTPRAGVVSRIGGAPVGVDDRSWPTTRGPGAKWPMQHVLTLAAADLEGATLPGGAAAIALFIRDVDNNAASRPGNADTKIVRLGAKDLARGPFGDELPDGSPEPRALVVESLDVPAAVFDEDDDRAELGPWRAKLRRAAGYALGGPLWLQDAEHDGAFVLQFRASLVPMNLGDQGVMFVFTDTAFWQAS